MREFGTMRLPVARDNVAPDGSDVRVLLGLDGGGLAHFELAPGQTSTAVAPHRGGNMVLPERSRTNVAKA